MNRNPTLALVVVTAASLLTACSGADPGAPSAEHVARTASADTTSSSTIPQPVNLLPDGGVAIDPTTGGPMGAWNASVVDLWAADSWAQCAGGLPSAGDQLPQQDPYLTWLLGQMNASATACTPIIPSNFRITYPQNPPTTAVSTGVIGWAERRLNPACNMADANGTRVAAKFNQGPPFPTFPAEPGNSTTFYTYAVAQAEVNWAEMNLCMAQHLREYASTGETLALSALDQRELLEITRERAQLAMLQYAHLGVVFASAAGTSSTPPATTLPSYLTEYELQKWARDSQTNTNAGQIDAALLTTLGQDFTAAVQLHSVVSGELANLLWRSASAHESSDLLPRTGPVDDWGPASWRQRLLAMLYGGDPLVTSTAAPPGSPQTAWEHFAGTANPRADDVVANPTVPLDWPGKRVDEPPFPTVDTSAPEVAALAGLARRADALYVKATVAQTDGGVPTYEDVDRSTTTSSLLYARVEARLEADACNACFSCACACAGNAACIASCGVLPAPGAAAIGAPGVANACTAAFSPTACPSPDAGASSPPACGVDAIQSTLSALSVTTAYPSTLLWQGHRVSPTHAATLASQLADAIPRVVGNTAATRVASLPGAVRLVGGANAYVTNPLPLYAGDWYHVDPAAALTDLGIAERAPLYSRLTSFAMPNAIDPAADGQTNGLLIRNDGDSPRTMGAASALAAVRDALQTALVTYKAPATGYFQRAQPIMDVIDAAIGTTALSTRAATSEVKIVSPSSACPVPLPEGEFQVNPPSCQLYTQTSTSGVLNWEVDLTLAADNPFAADALNPQQPAPTTTTYKLVAIPSGMMATMLATSPGNGVTTTTSTARAVPPAKTFLSSNNTIAALVQAAASASPSRSVTATSTTLLTRTTGGALLRRWQVPLKVTSTSDPRWSFVLVQTIPSTAGGAATVSYLPLGENVYLHTAQGTATPVGSSLAFTFDLPVEGQYLPYGGSLGETAKRAWAATPGNAVRPGFDGFGLASTWLPPTDAAQFGGQPGETASSYYLRAAGAAADEATAAVKSAMDELVAEEMDQATLAAAQQKAAGITMITAEGYCGGTSTSCDATTKGVKPNLPTWSTIKSKFANFQCPIGQAGYVDCNQYASGLSADQEALFQMFSIGNGSFTLGKAVAAAQGQTTPPTFSEYAGGSLQQIYLQQWAALSELEADGQSALAAGVAAWAATDAAYRQQLAAQAQVSAACSSSSLFGSLLDGVAVGLASLATGGVADLALAAGAKEAIGGGFTGFFDAANKCDAATAQANAIGDSQIVLAQTDAMRTFAGLSEQFLQAAIALQAASNEGAAKAQDARLAVAQANLEASLATDTLVTKFGSYRRYHSYDMWRAQALLESTRRYALTARRAVEGEFVLQLASMTADEPYVAAPATWADQVYQYDLDAPAAVGLAPSAAQAGGIYPNQLTDYVGNLNRLVAGYPVARPTAIARNDSSVLSFVGPDQHATETIGGKPVDVIQGDATRWQFFCPNTSTWAQHPAASQRPATTPLSQVCDPSGVIQPTHARLAFSLDPWGRVDGDVASPPVSQQYDARWVQLAVNLVGTGVKDCSRALDAQGCFTQPFVPYDLTHDGPAWVTDYDQVWRSLDVGTGVIEGGKALAAEEWLDPVNAGWSQPYVQAVARSELVERPFGGGYVLDVALAPEVRPERIESVQVLVQSSYWVKQN